MSQDLGRQEFGRHFLKLSLIVPRLNESQTIPNNQGGLPVMGSQHTRAGKSVNHKPKFRPAFAMSQQELSRQLSAGRIASMEVTQEPDGTYWIGVKLQGLADTFFVATKRNIMEPRRFRRLDVVVAFLKRDVSYVGALQVALVDTRPRTDPKTKNRR